MSESNDGIVLNDGIYNFLGGRNFILASKEPAFMIDTGTNMPYADIAVADITVLTE